MSTKGARVLVVEDDPYIVVAVRRGLESHGYDVEECGTLADARRIITGRMPDIILLDLGLPDGDGIELVRWIRTTRATPIVVLSARDSEPAKVGALDEGADDYLTKPFFVEELVARLHAVVRRSSGVGLSLLQNGEVTMNLVTREVRVAGTAVELTAREFALLSCLLRSPGRTFTRAQLCEQVWNYHFDPGTNLVDVYVQHVRKKLGTAGPALIETVRGVGYRVRPEEAAAASRP